MKKTLSMILSALMLTGMVTTASAFEKGVDYVVIEEVDPDNYVGYGDSYPGSGDWDWPECTSGSLLKGTIIAGCDAEGNHRWKNTPNGNASFAFDGDTSTLFDPFESSDRSWAGIILDQPYELTEVRVMVRGKYLSRMNGAAIQGSQDGEKWVTIVFFPQDAEAEDYHIFTPNALTDEDYIEAGYSDYSCYWVGHGAYTMYRYVNLSRNHGEAIELEFYGNPGEATEVTDDLVASTTFAAVNFFNGSIEDTGIQSVSTDGSITGTVIGAGGTYKDASSYTYAWDGDLTTFYDPAEAGLTCWTGIKVDEPVAINEVRVMPRAEWLGRTNGGYVQGSNDGEMWTTLASFSADDCAYVQEWIGKEVNVEKKFTMFRYVNNGANHGDVVEVALFEADGEPVVLPAKTPKPETEAVETTAPVETAAPETQAPETLAPFVAPEGAVNLATVGTIKTSSANDVSILFDGSVATGGRIGGTGKDFWIGVELAQPTILSLVRLTTWDENADGKTEAPHAIHKTVVEGSNDGETWDFIMLFGDPYYEFEDYAMEYELGNNYWTEYAFDGETDEDADATTPVAYKYYRVWSDDGNDYWGEIEFWGTVEAAAETTAPETTAPVETAAPETTAPVETAAPETTAPTTGNEPSAPQTFDFGVIAAVAAVVSAAGYAISKKRK